MTVYWGLESSHGALNTALVLVLLLELCPRARAFPGRCMNAELCCNECRVGITISLLSFSLEDAAALSCPCPESLSVLCQRLDSGSATSARSPGMGRARRAAAQPLAQSPELGSWRRAAAKPSLSSPWHAVGDTVPRVHASSWVFVPWWCSGAAFCRAVLLCHEAACPS